MFWIAFGDVHESTHLVGAIPDLSEAESVIITGDITNRGIRAAAEEVIEAVEAVNPRILAQPGNMDTDSVETFLRERGMDMHLQVRELTPGVSLMGVGLSTPTPFGTPGEVAEETLAAWLDETYAKVGDGKKLICAIHEAPFNTKLDRLSNGQNVGSPGVRKFIERVQPDVVVTGHIHESTGVDMIGRSVVINPGMLAGGGYVRIEFQDGELTAELLSV